MHTHAYTYPKRGQLQPDNEHGLERKIPGDVVEQGAERKALEEVEEAKDGPVCEPLDVVLCLWGLDGLEGEVGGEAPADEVGDGCGEGVDEVEGGEEGEGAEDCVDLGDVRAALEGDEHGVLVELHGTRGE